MVWHIFAISFNSYSKSEIFRYRSNFQRPTLRKSKREQLSPTFNNNQLWPKRFDNVNTIFIIQACYDRGGSIRETPLFFDKHSRNQSSLSDKYKLENSRIPDENSWVIRANDDTLIFHTTIAFRLFKGFLRISNTRIVSICRWYFSDCRLFLEMVMFYIRKVFFVRLLSFDSFHLILRSFDLLSNKCIGS